MANRTVLNYATAPCSAFSEMEVFRIAPEEGKCYEHIEATRSQDLGGGNRRYCSSNKPRYVGKFIRDEKRYSRKSADGVETRGFFNDNGTENHLDYSYQGNTCFIKVPCKVDLNSKAKNQALRNVYESKTGHSANPGQGPANLIRSFAGIRVPKGAEGGKRSRKLRKNKKTRKYLKK